MMSAARSRKDLRAKFVDGIGPQRGADHGTAGGQRSARPPDVQRADVPVADRLLAPGVGRDALDGQIDFDETGRVRVSTHVVDRHSLSIMAYSCFEVDESSHISAN